MLADLPEGRVNLYKTYIKQHIVVTSILYQRFRKSAGSRTLGCEVGSEHSSKEIFEQRINSYPEHLYMSPRKMHIKDISSLFKEGEGVKAILKRLSTHKLERH